MQASKKKGVHFDRGYVLASHYRVNGFTVLCFKTESGVIFEGFCEFTENFVWPGSNTSSKYRSEFKFGKLFEDHMQ